MNKQISFLRLRSEPVLSLPKEQALSPQPSALTLRRIGVTTMRKLSKQLVPWLNVLLILSMLANLLPPATVMAAPAAEKPAGRHFDDRSTAVQSLLRDENTLAITPLTNDSIIANSHTKLTPVDTLPAKTFALPFAGLPARGFNSEARLLPKQQQPSPSKNYMVVATDHGVYYTGNIAAGSPVWQPINNGFVITDDMNVSDLWHAGPDTEGNIGPLWATTPTGLWRNANPLGGGAWQKLTPTDPIGGKTRRRPRPVN
jgi:hypothetical protein